MRRAHAEPVVALLALLALLAALDATAGVTPLGWAAALAAGALGAALLAVALRRVGRRRLGPADRVTVLRAVLVGGVTALAAGALERSSVTVPLVTLAVAALVLDAVDGWVARRSGTGSPLGAALDMEVDAFLILVLSVVVARTTGGWVLALGAARYALLAAEPLLPWLRAPLPPRFWAKAVAAVTGVVLTSVAAGVLPYRVSVLLLVVTLALLAESFGHQVRALLRLRRAAGVQEDRPDPRVVVAAAGEQGRRA